MNLFSRFSMFALIVLSLNLAPSARAAENKIQCRVEGNVIYHLDLNVDVGRTIRFIGQEDGFEGVLRFSKTYSNSLRDAYAGWVKSPASGVAKFVILTFRIGGIMTNGNSTSIYGSNYYFAGPSIDEIGPEKKMSCH